MANYEKTIFYCFNFDSLLQISLTSAFATASVSFEMQNADMKPNRLFSVALSANSGNRLSAATFEFTYDPDYIEFRKVKAVNNGSKIRSTRKAARLKLFFLILRTKYFGRKRCLNAWFQNNKRRYCVYWLHGESMCWFRCEFYGCWKLCCIVYQNI